MIRIYVRNMLIYALYVAVCIALGVIFWGFEGYFTTLTIVRLIVATLMVAGFNILFAHWEYMERVNRFFNNYIADRIKNAKHVSLEELENL